MSGGDGADGATEALNVANVYRTLRAQINELASKINELDSDKSEHALVLRTIAPLARERRCYRSIGGVLVERTVGEVQPAVEKNLAGIEELISKLTQELRDKERQADELRVKYNIPLGDAGVEARRRPQTQAQAADAIADGSEGIAVNVSCY